MELVWDQTGEKIYETGVSKGVLFIPNNSGVYDNGVAWNGLTSVTESPSGAEASPQYADNILYLNLVSTERFGATIEAYTYPPEFEQFDGSASPEVGVAIGQQNRGVFGFCYQTLIGNDVAGQAYGYKIHIVYGAQVAPSEKAYNTVNDSPEAVNFSWEVTTIPTPVGTIGGTIYKPTASLVVDSTKVDADSLAALEDALYGTVGDDPRLPTPAEVVALFAGTVTLATPATPTYNSSTDIITIPSTTGVIYSINGEDVPAGSFGPITASVVVDARPAAGYKFPAVFVPAWLITFA